jgi:glycogen phosphorylase
MARPGSDDHDVVVGFRRVASARHGENVMIIAESRAGWIGSGRVRALRRFTVRAALPEPLEPLGDLVAKLRWSWNPDALDLFDAVDPDGWERCEHDPVKLLGEVGADRMATLAKDRRFLRRLKDAHEDLDDYLSADRWYQGLGDSAPKAIAYFSPEFGITEVLPQYSGGLGILAGDHLKAASDLGVPIMGVGLLYRRGYFKQSLSPDGWQQERYPPLDPNGMPLTLLHTEAGDPLKVGVGLSGGRELRAQVWKAQVGRVPLLMLDSDVDDNGPTERDTTDRLYGGGAEHRLAQEMLLGVGGVRAVRAYCALTGHPEPEVFHTNEGHAGFLGIERIRELAEGDGLSFDDALAAVRSGTVFTTHTPVPAGIDRFPVDLIAAQFGGQNASPGVPVERIVELGAEADPTKFNMAHMGLRLAQRANGVSKLHGVVSREMFGSLWPGFDSSEVPITTVTNGVHAPTWVAREVMELAEQEVGSALVEAGTNWDAISKVPDDAVWSTRRLLRTRLVAEVRRRVRDSWLQRGASEAGLTWVDGVFDPDVLTIGFARRVPSYKRLTLMLSDRERLTRLLLDPDRPVQLVIAGKSHPADDGGKALIQQLVRFADDPLVRHRIAFLPDYDIGMARSLYHGCDVWLNNPLRPLEACGTSGMKSALNGGLNLSIRDGWWDEMFDGANGWAIPSAPDGTEPDVRDAQEALALYDLIENQVRGRFYDTDRDGLPRRWIEMVRHTLQSLGPQVLASRMVRDYVRQLYMPAAESSRRMASDSYTGAKQLAEWLAGVKANWPQVRVAHVETIGVGNAPELGQSLELHAVVSLGELRPDEVRVQAVFGRVDDDDELRDAEHAELTYAGPVDGSPGDFRFDGAVPMHRRGPFGYTVRVLPRHEEFASEAELALVAVAVDASGYAT